MLLKQALLLVGASLLAPASAFDYSITSAGEILLTDEETQISGIETLFLDQNVMVTVDGVEWEFSNSTGGDFEVKYETFVDDELQDSGTISLVGTGRELPTSFDVGVIKAEDKGEVSISVTLTLDENEVSTDSTHQAFKAGNAIWPLLLVLFLALTTRSVEFSLTFSVFVGACMVAGNVKDGFKMTFERFILLALADLYHGYVYLFTMFLSGLVGMLEKSGGMKAFAKTAAHYATSSRSAQLITFSIGCLVFFDDYANVLLAGETMRPLTDMLFVSREKLAFIVDGTSAPIASLTPVSSWVGYEISLIQEELDKLYEIYGEDMTISTKGMTVFLQSIKYRYYPIFMIVLIPTMIYFKRDFGGMLISERKTQVYRRKDGGDGCNLSSKHKQEQSENQPEKDTPLHVLNFFMPIVLLVFFIFYLLIQIGNTEPGLSFLDMLQNTDSYPALLFGTVGAAICSMIWYGLQTTQDGQFVLPTPDIVKALIFPAKKQEGEDEEPSNPRVVMNMFTSLEAFLYGMMRIFPALVVLTLAWAIGSIMTAVGVDRLFSSWLVGGVSASQMPTLSFIVSVIMALATGTSWGTMAILFPLIVLPTYEISDGDEIIMYSTIAGILSGSVAGDHMSPISDTTVLSSLACDCELLRHVSTQAPYAFIIVVISILFGTLPIGKDTWPNYVGILLGALCVGLVIFGLFRPVLSESGAFDPLTELYLKVRATEDLEVLRKDTADAFANQAEQETLLGNDNGEDDLSGKPKELNDEEGGAKEEEGDGKADVSSEGEEVQTEEA